MGGHTNFMQNQTKIAKAMACPIRVALMFTLSPHTFYRLESPTVQGWSQATRLGDERVGKQQQHSNTNTNHWNGVEQTSNDKHFNLQL